MQVPLLLRLGEDMRALQRASESGDTDLVYLVLFRMYRSLPLQDFVSAIASRPAIARLFLAYCARTVSLFRPPAGRSIIQITCRRVSLDA